MKEQSQSQIYLIILLIVVISMFAFISVFYFYGNSFVPNENTTSLTYEKCCNGSFCTDTYYYEELNLCVLSLCENSPFIDQKQCYYKSQ